MPPAPFVEKVSQFMGSVETSLEYINTAIKENSKKLDSLREDVWTIQAKAGVIGGVVAVIGTILLNVVAIAIHLFLMK